AKNSNPNILVTEPGMKLNCWSSKGMVKMNSKNDQRTTRGILSETKAAYLNSIGEAASPAPTLAGLTFVTLYNETATKSPNCGETRLRLDLRQRIEWSQKLVLNSRDRRPLKSRLVWRSCQRRPRLASSMAQHLRHSGDKFRPDSLFENSSYAT